MKIKITALIVFVFDFILVPVASQQIAAIKVTTVVPGSDTITKGVYIAGSFNYWHAGDSLYRMQKVNDGVYTIVLPVFEYIKYEYKYTLGSWERVEVDERDSSIHNRLFFSVNGINILDTVRKWKEPKPVDSFANARMNKITAMKDSVLNRLQPELSNMLELLKSYVNNLLSDKPSFRKHRRLDKKGIDKLGYAYTEITGLLWKAMNSLTPEEKKRIKASLDEPAGKQDFLNTFSKSLNAALEGQQ